MRTVLSNRARRAVSLLLVLAVCLLPAAAPLAAHGADAAVGRRATRAAMAPSRSAYTERAHAPAPAPAAFGQVPLFFEKNHGQADDDVSYVAHGRGQSLMLTPHEARLLLARADGDSQVVRMRLVDAAVDALPAGTRRLPGRIDDFAGHDRSRWRTGIETFAQVRYDGVYPGIDMVYYGRDGRFEYDFEVAPGADPQRIGLRFAGVDRVEVDGRGDLLLHLTDGGVVRQQRPFSYQDVAGERRPVDSRYVVGRVGDVHIAVGSYDRGRPLVIDPVIEYAGYFGDTGADSANDVAVDPDGNVYIVGTLTIPADGSCRSADEDAFVLKLDPTGSILLYGARIGACGQDLGQAIAVDGAGHAYITGLTRTDFPTTDNAYSRTLVRSPDAFVVKLDTNAAVEESLVYSSFFNADEGAGIAVDAAGMIYVTGTATWGFPTTPGAFQRTCPACPQGASDAFVAKFDPSGWGAGSLVYSTYLGGSSVALPYGGGSDAGKAIVVDAEGNAIVTGETAAGDFPVVNAVQGSYQGGWSDAFVAKLNASGSGLLFSTYLGTSEWDAGASVALDRDGNVFVAGSAGYWGFPTTAGAYQRDWSPGDCSRGGMFATCPDAFVAKLDAAGGLAYATYLGGPMNDYGYGVAVDGNGHAIVTGYAVSYLGLPIVDPLPGGERGANDAFVVRFNADGSAPTFGTYLGGTGKDEAFGVAVDGAGSIYIVGRTLSADLPGSGGGYSGDADAFVVKIGN